jgi:hypothetical protein
MYMLGGKGGRNVHACDCKKFTLVVKNNYNVSSPCFFKTTCYEVIYNIKTTGVAKHYSCLCLCVFHICLLSFLNFRTFFTVTYFNEFMFLGEEGEEGGDE